MHFFTFILVISCTDMVPTTSTGLPHDQLPQFKIDHLQILLKNITIPKHMIKFPAQSESFYEDLLKYSESALIDCDYQEFIRLKKLFQKNNFEIIDPQDLLLSLQPINNLLKEIVCETFSYKDILMQFNLRTMNIIESIESLDLDLILEGGIRTKEKFYLYLLFDKEDLEEVFISYCTKAVQYLLKTKSILSKIRREVHVLKLKFECFFTKFWNTKSRYLKDIISGQIKAEDLYVPDSVSMHFTLNIAEYLSLSFNSSNVSVTDKKYEIFWLTTFMNYSRDFLFKKLDLYREIFTVEIANEMLVAYDSILNRYCIDLNRFIPIDFSQENLNIMELISHFLSDPDELSQILNQFDLMFNSLILSLRNEIIRTIKYFEIRNLRNLTKLKETCEKIKSINNRSSYEFQKRKFASHLSFEIFLLKELTKEFHFKRQILIECTFYQRIVLMHINKAIDSIISERHNIPVDLKFKYGLLSIKNSEQIQEISKNIDAYWNLPNHDEPNISMFYNPVAEYYFQLMDILNRISNQ